MLEPIYILSKAENGCLFVTQKDQYFADFSFYVKENPDANFMIEDIIENESIIFVDLEDHSFYLNDDKENSIVIPLNEVKQIGS